MEWKISQDNSTAIHFSGMKIFFKKVPNQNLIKARPIDCPGNVESTELAVMIRKGFDVYRENFVKTYRYRPVIKLDLATSY